MNPSRDTMRRERSWSRIVVAAVSALILIGGFLVLTPHVVHAQGVNLGLEPVGQTLGLGSADIRVIAARIIRNFFGLLGIVAVCLILYGGWLWMSSQGEEGQIEKAKQTITSAVIGLAIILSAVAITQFVLNRLLDATGAYSTSGGSSTCVGAACYIPGSGALGQIIEYHYPERSQTDVPRNTRVMVVFKEPMDPASFIDGYASGTTSGQLNDANVHIYRSADGEGTAFKKADVLVAMTPDQKTFVFHVPLLGSATADVPYIVKLLGGDAIKKIVNGKPQPAFVDSYKEGYWWDFTTGRTLDLTPPQVSFVVPRRSSVNPRNVMIEVTFTETIDPTSAQGDLPAFTNLAVESMGASSTLTAIPGTFTAGFNHGKTISFLTNDECGQNSCGEKIFCLPANTHVGVTLHAATLGPNPPQSDPTKAIADGVVDMTGNSLDGNGDGAAQGPTKDDYVWDFQTTSAIDVTPPVVLQFTPAANTARVPFETPITALFSKPMSMASFTSKNILLAGTGAATGVPLCYIVAGEAIGEGGQTAPPASDVLQSRVVISHCPFAPEANYVPSLTSGVRDIFQNCYVPGATEQMNACSPSAMAAGGYTSCCNGSPCRGACVISGAVPVCATP